MKKWYGISRKIKGFIERRADAFLTEESEMKHSRRLGEKIIIAAFWLLLWQIVSLTVDNNILLVGPAEVLTALSSLIGEGEFWLSLANSFLKIGAGFLIAALFGILFGTVAYNSCLFAAVLSPLISLMKSIPVASFVILAIIWLGGSANLSVFVSFVVVFPMVYLSTQSGLLSTNRKLLEMAFVFRIKWYRKIRYIYFPALFPYLLNCFKTALGMAWKSGVAAELIGQPRHTIGGNLYQAKIFLDTPSLFAWTFMIILVSFLFEKLVLWLFGKLA